jgi:hypothetical protein
VSRHVAASATWRLLTAAASAVRVLLTCMCVVWSGRGACADSARGRVDGAAVGSSSSSQLQRLRQHTRAHTQPHGHT